MKTLKFFSKMWSSSVGSQCSDVGYRRRIVADLLPSFCRVNMLKLVSVLAILLTIGVGSAWGAQYVYVCNTNANWVTTSGGSTNVSYDAAFSTTCYYTDGTAWSGSGTNCCLKSGYFFLGKSGAYLTLPTFPGEKITSVVLQGSNGHSTSVGVNITAGGTAASTAQTWSTKGQSHVYAINSSYQASTLRIQVTNSNNTQFTSITINTAPNSSCAGTQLAMPDVTTTPSSGQIQLSWSAVPNATKYQVSWNGGTYVDATSPYTKTSLSNGTTYTWAVRAVGDGSTYCNSEANEESTKPGSTIRTITWKVGTSTHATTKVADGDHLVLPESPTPCIDGKIFAGWSASTINGTTNTKPTFVSSQTPVSGNQTYYAVFATPTANSYTKGDINDLFPGQTVLIVNSSNSKALSDDYVANNQDKKLQKVDVTISSNTITSMSNSHAIWTVENMGQKYYFKTSTGYLRATMVGDQHLSCSKGADPWTLTDASSGLYYMNSNSSVTSRLEYYSNAFTTYGTNATGTAYEMSFFVPTCSDYFTTCASCGADPTVGTASLNGSSILNIPF